MSWDYDFDDDDYYHGYGYSDDDYEESNGDYGYDTRRFENYDHGRELLNVLARQRETGEFLDVVVQVEGREFPCHRAVLASTRYFNTMMSSNLAESSSEVVQLQDVDATSFSKILDFLYTGKICTTKDDVQDILQTAHMLQLGKIVEYCREFIEDNLCQSNCLGVMSLADLYGFSALKKKARDMVVSNFPDVTQEEVFLNLSVEDLADLLGDEHLKVTNEDDVVNSVIRWLDENPGNHQKAILRILQEIRLSCVSVSVLRKLESNPVIQESSEYLTKVTAAREKLIRDRGTSDNLAIIVGGWKAVKKPSLHKQPVLLQPTPIQSIICLDPDSEQYYHITTLPTSVPGYMSVASAGRHLYVTGGEVHPRARPYQDPISDPSKQAFRYDFSSDIWLRLPDMPRGRAGHQSVVVDGKLFVAGGDAEATSLLTIDCYDPEEEAWMKMHVQELFRTSPIVKVTAFRDKVAFIEVQEYAEDPSSIDVQFGVAMLLGSRMGFRMQRSTDEGKLCVHSVDVKTNVWRHANIYVPSRSLEHVDILVTTVHDKLYIRVGYTATYDLYIFDAEEETLIKGDARGRDWEETVLRAHCEHSDRYVRQDGIVDTIGHYEFGARRQTSGDHHIPQRQAFGDYDIPRPREAPEARSIPTRQTPLPFALFGHSFLQTKKSSIGWYCRDLAALGKDGKREQGSLTEPTGATSSE
ncbi:kelch-like protein 24 [Branchiostoma floridae x Branchiostoma belcheri]